MLMADRPDSVAVAGRTGRAGLLRHLSILLALAACLSVSSTGPGAARSGPIDATTNPPQRTIAEVTNDIESRRLSGAALAEPVRTLFDQMASFVKKSPCAQLLDKPM